MMIQLLRRHSITKEVLVGLLVSLMTSLPAWSSSLPAPTDRWMKHNGSVKSNLPATANLVPIDDELPDLNPTVRVGQVIVSNDGTTMTVKQSTDRALIDWSSFNIGRNNAVRFNQPGAESVALNRIYSQSPSKIFGNLEANGNIWLFNPNGIFFGQNAQVNVRGLIASTMEFNGLDETNFDTADLFGAIDQGKPFLTNARLLADGSSYCADNNCSIALDSDPSNPICSGPDCNLGGVQAVVQSGVPVTCTGSGCRKLLPRIIVDKGARVATAPGGQLLMAAPEVVNEGSLVAGEGGQAILAASKKDVYLAVTNSAATDLRGFIVEVDSGAANPEGGAVVNAGDVTANLGNVTLVAKEIVQAGQLRSSTAVDVNGSIRLISRDGGNVVQAASSRTAASGYPYYLDEQTEMPETNYDALGRNPGTVIMQEGSSIRVAIDNSKGLANDSLEQVASQIHIEGRDVYMGKGAEIVAPGANVTVRAHNDPTNIAQTVDTGARFIMDDGAVIDVSGTTDTVLDASRNTLEFFVTSNELKDSPQQKGGALLRKTVKVDVRRGTPLFDWTQGLATVAKSAGERSSAGGDIDIKAGAVDVGAGATLDVSGGYVTYQAGIVESSSLVANGVYDIADVDIDVPYTGVAIGDVFAVVDPKWGQRSSFRPGTLSRQYFRDAYQHGNDAGSLRILAGQQLYNPTASFRSQITTGPYQRTAVTAPAGGVLAFDAGQVATDIYIHNDLDDFGNQLSQSEIHLLAGQLQASGANKLVLNTSGVVNLGTQQNPLYMGVGLGRSEGVGSISDVYGDLKQADLLVNAGGIHQYGVLRTPSASIHFNQVDINANDGRTGDGFLSVNGIIDTSGQWTNDFGVKGQPTTAKRLHGGDVVLNSEEELQLAPQALIRTDAGAALSADAKLEIGTAGDISLRNSGLSDNSVSAKQATVDIQGQFSALDGAAGGVLTVEAENVSVGGAGPTSLTNQAVVGNEFFARTDVGGYRFIAANGNVVVESGAAIDLSHKVLSDPRTASASGTGRNGQLNVSRLGSADTVAPVLNRVQWTGSDLFRAASGSLQLEANRPQAVPGDAQKGIVELRAGSVITGAPGSSVSTSSTNRSLIDGVIALAGGTFSAKNSTVGTASEQEDADLFTYIFLGDNARIDMSAQAVANRSNPLFDQYKLVDAGTVKLTAEVGSVIVSPNAEVTLRGATVQPAAVNISRQNSGGWGGRIVTETVTRKPPALKMGAGTFNLLAEKGFALGNVIDFGQGNSAGYTGGTLNLGLTYGTGRKISTNASVQPTLDRLEIALGDNSGIAALSGFAFGDALPVGYIQGSTLINGRQYVTGTGKGFVNSANLSGNHLDRITLNTENSRCCEPDNTVSALSSVSVTGNIDISADSGVVIDAGWLNIADGSSLTIAAPYAQIGESANVRFDADSSEATAIQQLLPSLPADLKAGTGSLQVDTQLLDLVGNIAVTGTDSITFNASRATRLRSVISIDVSTDPSVATPMANRMDVFGDTAFNTPIVYATTLSDYSINRLDAGAVTFNGFINPGNGQRAAVSDPVLSYGSQFRVNAEDVTIDTAIVAPFGAIDINAVNSPSLLSSAYLSVAALDDTRIPFGRLQGGVSWIYPLSPGSAPMRFSATGQAGTRLLPEKVIRLSGKTVQSEVGSRINLSGGGEVYATEFVAGLGGSRDILSNVSYNERFVLVPGMTSGFAPFDFAGSRNSQIPFGTRVEIVGSSSLPDGSYTVLPASYAFLRNAYVVTPQTVANAVTPGFKESTFYGAEIVAGRFGNVTGSSTSNWQAFRIDQGFGAGVSSQINDPRGEYRFVTLDNFFAPAAPGVLPQENGRLAIDVLGNVGDQLSLLMMSSIISSSQSRIGSSVDINSNQSIVIADSQPPTPGTLVVDPALVNGTGADSVLIGGRRSWDATREAWQVNTAATSISADNVAINSKEVVLTAKSSISLDNGASVDTTGNSGFVGSQWLADVNAATLLSSASRQSRLLAVDGPKNYGALDTSNGSVTTSGTLAAAYDGSNPLSGVDVSQAFLQVFSDAIVLGSGAGATVGQGVLHSAEAVELEASGLLQIATDISLANLREVTLRTPLIDVADGVQFSVDATDRIALEGVSGPAATPVQRNSSTLLRAPEIVLGAATDKPSTLALSSADVDLDAGRALATKGDVSLEAAGNLTVTTPIMLSQQTGEVVVSAADTLQMLSPTAAAQTPPTSYAAGNSYQFSATDMLLDTTVWAPAGMIAAASGNSLVVGANADLVVPSVQVAYPDGVVHSSEGIISLIAGGDLTVADARSLNFGNDGLDSNGGLLELLTGGNLSVANVAAMPLGDRGRSVALQASNLDIAALLGFNRAGFDNRVSAISTGVGADMVMASGDTLSAKALFLAAVNADVIIGSGAAIDVAGNQQAATLYAGNNLVVANGASIAVSSVNGQGGDLSLQTPAGEMVVDPGADIQVDGDLEVVADYAATATDVQIDSADTIGGKLALYLAHTFTDADATLTVSDFDSLGAIGQAISDTATAVTSNFINRLPDLLRPLIDITTSGDLDIAEAIDLASLRSNGEPGRLVIRSAGDITINGSLSDGVEQLNPALGIGTPLYLKDDESWDMQLAAGALNARGLALADLTAGSSRDITLADGSFIRTGTGDIVVSSSGSLLLGTTQQEKAYIATVGRAEHTLDILGINLPSWNSKQYLDIWAGLAEFSGFSLDAGDVRLNIGGDLTGFVDSGLTSASFIRSVSDDAYTYSVPGFVDADFSGRRVRALALGAVESGVHAIGGGNISTSVRGDISHLGFSTPGVSSGAQNNGVLDYSIQTTSGLVSGLGGDIDIAARGNITHSAFSNDGGVVQVSAGGVIGRDAVSGVGTFLSGSYSDIRFSAGRDIQLEGIANTTVMPFSDNQAVSGVMLDLSGTPITTPDTAIGWFFSGYDVTRLALTSVAGDIRFTGDYATITGMLGPDLAGNLSSSSNETRFTLLPSMVSMNALHGDIVSETSFTLFPNQTMDLALRAGGNLRPELIGAGSQDSMYFYLPDFDSSLYPTDTQPYSVRVESANSFGTVGNFADYNNPNYRTKLSYVDPRTRLIQRDPQGSVKLYAVNGSIGNEDQIVYLQLVTPLKVDAFAGGDINNVAFDIQHSNAGDISQIRAGNDFVYRLEYSENALVDGSGTQFVKLAGPGDLIVSAGGDIDLGASGGISTIGNQENALLPDVGASIHLFAGYSASQTNFSRLVGDGVTGFGELSGIGSSLNLPATAVNSLTLNDWFLALAGQADTRFSGTLIDAVARATGRGYSSVAQAVADWNQLSEPMRLRTSVYAIKELALASPELLVSGGRLLFNKRALGEQGFASTQARQQAFANYWDGIAALITLERLLTPARIGDFTAQVTDLPAFSALPLDQQINTAVSVFNGLDQPRQLLIAESILNQQLRQSGIEAANAGRTLAGFERGFVAMRRFYGSDLDAALIAAALRTRDIQTGVDASIKPGELSFGQADGAALGSFSDVLAFWERDSGEDFNLGEINRLLSVASLNQLSVSERDALEAKYGDNLALTPDTFVKGNASLVFSSVKSSAPGGSINFNLPTGEVDVGLSADLIKSLNVKYDKARDEILTSELGVIVEFFGDINANVASGFNVNESRAFSLAGGAVNLWASWGDIDAGKGAKTAVTTPEARFVVNPNSGSITKVSPPAISGSGIKTDERRLGSTAELTAEQRFYQLASGAGPAYLATPLGVVDAGEAGIESAGNLFIAARQVRGADNISVGGVSVGVATTTSVSANVASAGDSSSQATSAVSDSVSGSASDQASTATAFVTIQLLDTGIGLDAGPSGSADVCTGNDDGC